MIQDFLTLAIDVIVFSYVTLLTLEFLMGILPLKQLPLYSSATSARKITEQIKPLSDMKLQSTKPSVQLQVPLTLAPVN
ncbi:hypothetical protein B7486_54570 [cyanobacterium TDX16]|nr:hypothetical protein B7486_54570 [cyanobacterium TDX16]